MFQFSISVWLGLCEKKHNKYARLPLVFPSQILEGNIMQRWTHPQTNRNQAASSLQKEMFNFKMNVSSRLENFSRKYHQCTYCDYGSYILTNLKNHVILRHTKEKRFMCHVCRKPFYLKHHLRRHTEKIHNIRQ